MGVVESAIRALGFHRNRGRGAPTVHTVQGFYTASTASEAIELLAQPKPCNFPSSLAQHVPSRAERRLWRTRQHHLGSNREARTQKQMPREAQAEGGKEEYRQDVTPHDHYLRFGSLETVFQGGVSHLPGQVGHGNLLVAVGLKGTKEGIYWGAETRPGSIPEPVQNDSISTSTSRGETLPIQDEVIVGKELRR